MRLKRRRGSVSIGMGQRGDRPSPSRRGLGGTFWARASSLLLDPTVINNHESSALDVGLCDSGLSIFVVIAIN